MINNKLTRHCRTGKLNWRHMVIWAFTLAVTYRLTVYNRENQRGSGFPSGKFQYSEDQQNTPKDVIACHLPKMNLYDPEIMKFVKKGPDINCSNERSWISLELGTGRVRFDSDKFKEIGGFSCRCKYIRRGANDFDTSTTEVWEPLTDGQVPKSDFLRVQCTGTKDVGKTYENDFAQVVPDHFQRRVSAADKNNNTVPPADGDRDGDRATAEKLSVYMLTFDTVSRLLMQRKLPKTYEYLVKQLEAVVLEGYNIVGDGTPQALIPILTGQTELELPLTRKRYKDKANYVNIYPWAWDVFRKAGYATLYSEDTPATGTFTYRLKGFKEQPTTHDMRTFYVERAKTSKGSALCIGNEKEHNVFLKYGASFLMNYGRQKPQFAFTIHALLTHDDINRIDGADAEIRDHLKLLLDSGTLNRTMLIFMSDHGPRFSEIRNTVQGPLEERLPFFSFVAPKWWREKYSVAWENLKANAQRLTTPFDIHPTLLDLLHWENRGGTEDGPKKPKRGRSLWGVIPKERTCGDADIETHWCTCLTWKTVNASGDATVKRLVNKFMNRVNYETVPVRKLCVPLTLKRVNFARVAAVDDSVQRYKSAKDYDGFVADLTGKVQQKIVQYQLQIETSPNDALYEVTISVTFNLDNNKSGSLGNNNTNNNRDAGAPSFRLQSIDPINLDAVSRINSIGRQSHCVAEDHFMIRWCMCRDQLNINQPTN